MSILKNNLFKSPLYLLVCFLIITCLGVASWLGIQAPMAISKLYASYNDPASFDYWWKFLAMIFLGEYLNRIIYEATVNKFIQTLLQNIREDCYSLWIRSYPTSKKENNKTYTLGEILARIMSDTESIKELFTSGSFAIIIDLFFIVSCFIGFMRLNEFIGISFISIEVLVCVLLLWGSKFMAKVYVKVRKASSDMARVLTNLVEGLPQAFHTPNYKYALKRGDATFDVFLETQLKANIWDASYYSFTESLFPIFLVILVLLIPFSNLAQLAVVAAIIDLLQRSISPIKEVAGKISNIQRAMTGIDRLQDFQKVMMLRPRRQMNEVHEVRSLKSFHLNIEIFKYGQDERTFRIKDFYLEGTHGAKIGIIGKSGSGKSTILKIITGELEPQSFNLIFKSVDGHFEFTKFDPREVPAYREQISLISQDSHIFTESLGFNICLGKRESELSEFWNFCQRELPYLKTWKVDLDEVLDPSQISLGQKQLISSLRSCFLSRPIVLLDEISSSLDSSLESSLRILTHRIQEHSLLIVVAHRIETIIDASQIIVMDKGNVVARGNHKDLLSQSEIYQDFVTHSGRL